MTEQQTTDEPVRRKPGRPKGSTKAQADGRADGKADGKADGRADGESRAVQGEVITNPTANDGAMVVADAKTERTLTRIANGIRKEFGKGIDAQFAMGRLLNEARELLPSDTEFGQWVAAQGFPFSRQTAYRLQQGALREPEVRAFIEAQAKANRDILVTTAIKELDAGEQPSQELKDVGKRVRDLLSEPVVVTPLTQFRQCGEQLVFADMSVNDLAEFAEIVQSLVGAYTEERKRRTA